MKKCPFCGADIEDTARFCLYCMEPLTEKKLIRLRRKKRLSWVLLAAGAAVLLMLAILLIGHWPQIESLFHPHSFTVKNAASKYLHAEATCYDPATYYYSCACGAKSKKTFSWGKPKSHTKVTIPGTPADCVNDGSPEQTLCSDCGLVYSRQYPQPALGHTFVLGDPSAVCTTCGTTSTIKINFPEFPYSVNDSIRIDSGTYVCRPSVDGSWRVSLQLTCTNVSSAKESYMLAFHLGDNVSTHGGGTLAPQESRVTSISINITDPNGTYDLVFVEG